MVATSMCRGEPSLSGESWEGVFMTVIPLSQVTATGLACVFHQMLYRLVGIPTPRFRQMIEFDQQRGQCLERWCLRQRSRHTGYKAKRWPLVRIRLNGSLSLTCNGRPLAKLNSEGRSDSLQGVTDVY